MENYPPEQGIGITPVSSECCNMLESDRKQTGYVAMSFGVADLVAGVVVVAKTR